MITSNNIEGKKYEVRVTRAKAYSVGTFVFDMNVNGIDIYGCWYKEGVKEGREWNIVTFPSRKYNDKYYPYARFFVTDEVKADIARQIESLLGGVQNG